MKFGPAVMARQPMDGEITMAVTSGPNLSVGTLIAALDLTASYLKFVALNPSGQVIPASDGAVDAPLIGVLQNKPLPGRACDIVFHGFAKIITASLIPNAGTPVTSDSAGSPKIIGDLDTPLAAGFTMSPIITGSGEIVQILVSIWSPSIDYYD
jgi:hypothetical protein